MKATTASAPLAEVAELNPRLPEKLSADDVVSFVPMAGVIAESASVQHVEERRYCDVSKGFTPFVRDDVLVAKITPCFENGKIAQANIEHRVGFGSTEFHVVRPRSGRADARYLLHFLRQDHVRVDGARKMTGSAGQRRVPEHFLAQLEVPLPPLPEQRRIADILDRAEALRAKRRAAIALLGGLTAALFNDMFGDPASNPRRWPVAQLGELTVDGPKNGLYKPSSDYGAGTRILRIDAFYDGKVTNLDALKRLNVTEDELESFGLSENDLVINRVNSIEYLGKCALITGLQEPVVFESNMMRLRVDQGRLAPRYIAQFLQSGHIRSQILRGAKRAVNQASINQGDVCGFAVNLPPLELQREFTRRAEAIDNFAASLDSSLAELDALFATLQHRAFRGELWREPLGAVST